jgi:DNA-binding MarR family transcriptional regulator
MARSAPVRTRSSARPISCPEEVLFVELMRTADLLSRAPARLLKEAGLSPNQYNVLRILRGSPEGLLCGEISARMISRDPDITRLLDRLETRGLIGRCREDPDRRRVHVRISPDGLALVSRLDHPLCDLHRRQLGHLGPVRLRKLVGLLATGRSQLN